MLMSPASFPLSQITEPPGDISAPSRHRFTSSFSLITSSSDASSALHAHTHHPFVCILTVVYRLLFEQFIKTKKKNELVCECDTMFQLKLYPFCFCHTLSPMPTNWDDNSMLFTRLHILLTVCLSPQTWSFHQRQSLSSPVGPYTPQYSYPLRTLALGLVQGSTAQALCCRMTQPPPIL